jgi:hypothetical protein
MRGMYSHRGNQCAVIGELKDGLFLREELFEFGFPRRFI